MGIADQFGNAVAGHEDQVKSGIDKAGDMLDEKTGGKYAGQVDQAQDLLKTRVGGEQQDAPAEGEQA